EGYEYGSFHFLEPSFLHNYTDSTLEKKIVRKQLQLYEEENFEISCRLNSDIAELASTINDLHIWFRLNQEIEPKVHG
ncbi:hypothetical protein ABND92_18120, partial [Paenibacillus larvae]